MALVAPPAYDLDQLRADASRAAELFRSERKASERRWADFYSEVFTATSQAMASVLEDTDDLRNLEESLPRLLGEGRLDVLRYLCRPSISDDDLSTLSGVATRSGAALAKGDNAHAIYDVLSRNLNDDLFPWLAEDSVPSEADLVAACRSVAALVADQRTKTEKRGKESRRQEDVVRAALLACPGFASARRHDFDVQKDGPRPGEVFDGEAKVAGTKADVVLGLGDGRLMLLECKVSNTEVNSYKRLNHEVVNKVETWRDAFGSHGVVAGAVLQGCFRVDNLKTAQEAGACLFWSHDLSPLVEFVNAAR